MKIKTSELTGAALDRAVAQCEGIELTGGCYNRLLVDGFMSGGQSMLVPYSPSTDWAQGGPIIEREFIDVTVMPCGTSRNVTADTWEAWMDNHAPDGVVDASHATGPAPLIAAMRCYIVSKMGDAVDIPEALVYDIWVNRPTAL